MKRKRLAHAYLFHGQPGVGKDAMAIAMALSLNCLEGNHGGCETCSSCQRIMRLEHPNFHMILPVPTQPKGMKEEKYRDILRERALLRIANPYQEVTYNPEISTLPVIGIGRVRSMKQHVVLTLPDGGYRVFLVSHADRMTQEASNSLLKLLEEPPSRTVLFLTTSMPARLLDTIVSRCQGVRFDPLSEEDIQNVLTERWEVPLDKATMSARISGGSLQRALDMVGEGFEERREEAVTFLEKSLEDDTLLRLDYVDGMVKGQDKVVIQEILRFLEVWLRDLFYLNAGYSQKVMNADQLDRLQRFREKWSGFNAEEGVARVQQSIDFIEKNVYLNLILHSLSSELKECF